MSRKNKEVLVPQSDIDELEKARKYLDNLVRDEPIVANLLFDVTYAMKNITHKKYAILEK